MVQEHPQQLRNLDNAFSTYVNQQVDQFTTTIGQIAIVITQPIGVRVPLEVE